MGRGNSREEGGGGEVDQVVQREGGFDSEEPGAWHVQRDVLRVGVRVEDIEDGVGCAHDLRRVHGH
jgi:hypothetical protein